MSDKEFPRVLANDDGIRAAGKPDECFYCRQKVGTPHQRGCVAVHKIVEVRFVVDLLVEVPHSWDKSSVDFRYNDSSWCADNIIDLIKAARRLHRERLGHECLCSSIEADMIDTFDGRPYILTQEEAVNRMSDEEEGDG